ncbi:TPA: antibiotic biosynthesis monooxygenase, partial [Escherichia coli]
EHKTLSISWSHYPKAQQEGRESIFDFYKISIAHITREYSFKKDKDNV